MFSSDFDTKLFFSFNKKTEKCEKNVIDFAQLNYFIANLLRLFVIYIEIMLEMLKKQWWKGLCAIVYTFETYLFKTSKLNWNAHIFSFSCNSVVHFFS